jgi:hypothetical protein
MSIAHFGLRTLVATCIHAGPQQVFIGVTVNKRSMCLSN